MSNISKRGLVVLLLMAVAAIIAIVIALSNYWIGTEEGEVDIKVEAESGVLHGVEVTTAKEGYSGTGYVTGFENDEEQVIVQVVVPKAGFYELRVGYRTSGYKRGYVDVNGVAHGDIIYADIDGQFSETSGGSIYLNEGRNEIGLGGNWNYYDIDYIRVLTAKKKLLQQLSGKLVTPSASREAQAVMDYLVSQYGVNIISGQQDLKELPYLKGKTDKLPAILGLDFMDYSPSRVERGAGSIDTDHAIDWWHKFGGIVAFTWHWNAPSGLDEANWDSGFTTESTTFDLAKVLANPDSEDYRLLLRDMDAIADQLKRLQDEHVPVLWRPLHEAEGTWFWWGAKGPEAAKALYILMFDRFVNVHGLDNLIWVWNSVDADWYPGDAYVDVTSFDSYPRIGDTSSMVKQFDELAELSEHRKPIAMAENGTIPSPDNLFKEGAHWSWFCTWGGVMLRQNSEDYLKEIYNHERVITLDELPDFKG